MLSSATHKTGTNVLESRYDEIMANPTASVSGMKSARSGSPMMNAGTNTDRMHKVPARSAPPSRWLPRSTAVSILSVPHLHVDVLDRHGRHVDQDADRQRHAAQRHDVDGVARGPEPEQRPSRASGILATTTITLLKSRRNSRIMRPVRPAPINPSVATLSTAATTVGDSSNSKFTFTSLGTASRNVCIALWTSATTVNVDPVSFLMIGR